MKEKTTGIKAIIMYYENGMYRESYDVIYETESNGEIWKRYKVKGSMMEKHFNFIMSGKVEQIRVNGMKHKADRYTKREVKSYV